MTLRKDVSVFVVAVFALALAFSAQVASAATTCTFTTVKSVVNLNGNCTTDETILVPDGKTLNGNGYTITAVDPAGGHFVGAVIKNGGAVANVKNVKITASGLSDVCDAGGDRLRGIMFEDASGLIVGNTITDLRQVGSGCQEGNSIEIRHAPFDGTHPSTKSVEVANNTITNFMKTGILANGDVSANVHNNQIGASANQANLAANSIQFGFGAQGIIKANQIAGNQWCQNNTADATAILLFESANFVDPITALVTVTQNIIGGNADIGIYGFGNGMTINNNKVTDDNSITDCNVIPDDVGIGNYGTGNTLTNNKVGGFVTPYDNVNPLGTNKVNPNK